MSRFKLNPLGTKSAFVPRETDNNSTGNSSNINNQSLLFNNTLISKIPNQEPQYIVASDFIYNGTNKCPTIISIDFTIQVDTIINTDVKLSGFYARVWNITSNNPVSALLSNTFSFDIFLNAQKQVFSIPVIERKLPENISVIELQVKNNSNNPKITSGINSGIDIRVIDSKINYGH